jgi:hypothetical protein
MKWRSTVDSVRNNEITALAVIETLIASTLALWLAHSIWHNWIPFFVACALAPLLLLRTERSTRSALQWYDHAAGAIAGRLPRAEETNIFIILLVLLPTLTLFSLLLPLTIRVAATALVSIRHPLEAIAAIPRNWTRVAFCMDVSHPPEIIAGIEAASELPDKLRRFRISYLSKSSEPASKLVMVFFYTFSLPYRYSLKATAVVWLPLLWIVPHITAPRPLMTRLKLIHRSSWGRFVAAVSLTTLVMFVLKLLVFHVVRSSDEWWAALHVADVVDEFVAPYSIPLWQIASVTNAALAIGMYFVASHVLILTEDNAPLPFFAVCDVFTRYGAALRAAVSLYTSSCMLYIMASQVRQFSLAPIGDRVFPWL